MVREGGHKLSSDWIVGLIFDRREVVILVAGLNHWVEAFLCAL